MRLSLLIVLFALGAVTLTAADDPPAVPEDFKIVARFGPGYSDWLPWETTVTTDGKAVLDVRRGRSGGEPVQKESTLKKEDVAALFTKVKEAEFFKLKEQYKGKVTDQATLILEITADKKTHKVSLYGQRFLKEKEDQDAADRFLGVWSEVLKKVPAPNEKQTVELYKPGNYNTKKK